SGQSGQTQYKSQTQAYPSSACAGSKSDKLILRSIRSVHAGVPVMTEPFDLILQLQFSPFEFHYSQVIDRGMGQAFGDFVFEGLMSFFQFRKVRLHRHAVCLLNQWLSTI